METLCPATAKAERQPAPTARHESKTSAAKLMALAVLKINNFFPLRGSPLRHCSMIGLGIFPDAFRPGVAVVVEPPPEFVRHHIILMPLRRIFVDIVGDSSEAQLGHLARGLQRVWEWETANLRAMIEKGGAPAPASKRGIRGLIRYAGSGPPGQIRVDGVEDPLAQVVGFQPTPGFQEGGDRAV